MRYDNVDSQDPVQVLNASFGEVTFDANAYQALTQTTQAESETKVDLGGTHPVTILEWQSEEERTGGPVETYYYTHELDFTGASYSLKQISFTPTDTKITLHVALPESWTAAERCYCNLSFRFLFKLGDFLPDAPLKIIFSVDDQLFRILPRFFANRVGFLFRILNNFAGFDFHYKHLIENFHNDLTFRSLRCISAMSLAIRAPTLQDFMRDALISGIS